MEQWETTINAVVKSAPLLYCLLLPFAKMTEIIKGDHIGAFEIHGFMMSAIGVLRSIVDQFSFIAPYAAQLIDCVCSRLNSKASGLLLNIMHDLSPKGKEVNIKLYSLNESADSYERDKIWLAYYPIEITEKEQNLLNLCCENVNLEDSIKDFILEGFEEGKHEMEAEEAAHNGESHPLRDPAPHFEHPVEREYPNPAAQSTEERIIVTENAPFAHEPDLPTPSTRKRQLQIIDFFCNLPHPVDTPGNTTPLLVGPPGPELGSILDDQPPLVFPSRTILK